MARSLLDPSGRQRRNYFHKMNIDPILLLQIVVLAGVGLLVLYSATGQDEVYIKRQLINYLIAFICLIVVAQIKPDKLQMIGLALFVVCLFLLMMVLFFGTEHKGAQRWLNLGFVQFQPSELMKLALPMMISFYLSKMMMPISYLHFISAALIVLVPSLLIAIQPDLGTSLLIAASGLLVIFFAGLSWRMITAIVALVVVSAPLLWSFLLQPYQKRRILTMINPESDPLGSGYHIIQSKIAIGSGGLYGKGWLAGTQSQLEFLPERHTDFIFAVLAEEFGLLGVLLLFFLYFLIVARILWIASKASSTYAKLLAGSLGMTFFFYFFINVGMVSGILPVVGLPLPLVSYGGTSLVTIFIGFGILMSIYTRRDQR